VNAIANILVVDDHIALAENIAEVLESAGYCAWTAPSAEQALEAMDHAEVHALVTDYRLPGLNGAELIREVRRRGRHIPALVMCAYSDDGTIESAKATGALDVLCKPVALSRLLTLISELPQGAQRE
jgi:CheY-like chemotaxis protein